jgi:hypothetical protein
MNHGIDVSNISDAGSITHFLELLQAVYPPKKHGSMSIIWIGQESLIYLG